MTPLNILVACEESQAVCLAFRKRGHNAFSCDIQECSGGHPEWHLQGDVFNYLNQSWDIMVAFPPCTHLSVSGARWFKDKQKEQGEAIYFVTSLFANGPAKICIENPIGVLSTKWKKPTQIIQPWQFGHGETKSTCLWLADLPNLKPTNIVEGREQRVWKMAPGPDRAKQRSKTFPGVARAMAEQWSPDLGNTWNL